MDFKKMMWPIQKRFGEPRIQTSFQEPWIYEQLLERHKLYEDSRKQREIDLDRARMNTKLSEEQRNPRSQ